VNDRGEAGRTGEEGAQEAPGRHPQFRDCFSDDTLYTHGQQQPTHYGNDTCASIRINILMDTREGVGGWRSQCASDTHSTAVARARVCVRGPPGAGDGETAMGWARGGEGRSGAGGRGRARARHTPARTGAGKKATRWRGGGSRAVSGK
jgi:hypothetical protein